MDIDPTVHDRLRTYVINRLGAKDHGFSDLNLHQTSVHCNGAALTHTPADAEDLHHHEHYGPGGLRNHDYADRSWDPEKIATVLIECAEMDLTCDPDEARSADAFPIWRRAIDVLMTPATITTATQPDEHVHMEQKQTQDWDGTVCPDGQACEVYPRLYDVNVKRTHDGKPRGAHSRRIDNRPDDIARGLLAAQEALTWLEVAMYEPEDPLHYMLPRVQHAQTNLRASIAMLYPIVFPEHAARYAAYEAENATGTAGDATADAAARAAADEEGS